MVKLMLTVLGLLAATPALAHTGLPPVHGFGPGFAHPWQGFDHVLVMLAVGLWAARLGGNARWALPLGFLLLMGAGATLALAGLVLPRVETGIALSVLAMGTLLLLGLRPRTGTALGAVGLFALFHGHVHGAELPAGQDMGAHGAGFLLATALLHGLGLTGGWALRQRRIESFGRVFGALCTGAGLYFLVT